MQSRSANQNAFPCDAHKKKAKAIIPTDLRQDSYIFKPYPKTGKNFEKPSGTYIHDSMSDDKAIKIEGDENVFPGKLSWWGFNVYEWYYQDPTGKQVHHEVRVRNKKM